MAEKWALGLMSGTSLDGVDAALIRTDGNEIFEMGAWLTQPFDEKLQVRIRDAVYMRGDIAKIEQEITLAHADAVKALLKKAGLKPHDITVIGFHGQTIAHRPYEGITWQIGNGGLLAEKTGINVVCDFRRRDMAAGGQGAPLVPLYHAALVRHMELPIAVLNIGGIANVTWVGRSEDTGNDILALDIIAFDTGPGNVLINEWTLQRTGSAMDTGGKLALAGKADADILKQYLSDRFFSMTPPKSLDRNYFTIDALEKLSTEDGAATLTAFTAESIVMAEQHFPVPAKRWYISGGGRHNTALMQAIGQRFANVKPVETLGWYGDALEAQAFAYLAVRSLKKLPLTLPTTTGALRPVTGGAFYSA
ncbi:MAG TPA: anhydro-N-acetylmuramic acid kinase [Rickettsiales bacterium]|nr:anhydro-N-acetylmuramic acid kinase [Rickettsiales bacterium]